VRAKREAEQDHGSEPHPEPYGTFVRPGYVICKERSARKPVWSDAFYFDVFAGIVDGVVVEEARERPLLDMVVASGVPVVLLGPREDSHRTRTPASRIGPAPLRRMDG
jgi:hypothetical protein